MKKGSLYNYCWTHGFVMSANHTSKTCNNKAPGHKVEAMKDNTMWGTWQTSQHLNDGVHQQGKAVVTIN